MLAISSISFSEHHLLLGVVLVQPSATASPPHTHKHLSDERDWCLVGWMVIRNLES